MPEDRYTTLKKINELYGEISNLLREDGVNDEVMVKYAEAQKLTIGLFLKEEADQQKAELESMVTPMFTPEIIGDKEEISLKVKDKYYSLEEENGVYKIELNKNSGYGKSKGILYIFPDGDVKLNWKILSGAATLGVVGEHRDIKENKEV